MKPLGRNQIIACVVFGVILAGSALAVALGDATGKDWLSWAQWFGPTAVATITVPGSVAKMAGVLTGK